MDKFSESLRTKLVNAGYDSIDKLPPVPMEPNKCAWDQLKQDCPELRGPELNLIATTKQTTGAGSGEVNTRIESRFDALESMISPIVQKVKSKVGSELGKTEVECFNKSFLPAADLAEYVLPTHLIPEEYQYVYSMVLKYTQKMIDIAKQKNVNEETHIHPPTFKLLQDLVKHFHPAHAVEFFEKSLTGTVEIGYETRLCTRRGVLPVTGETDQLICIGGVPVGNVEVKNINMLCSTPREIAEILAEDKGFAERHKQRVGVEPRLFPSVLVSGQRWVFVDRSFGEGEEQYLLFPALVTFNLETVGEDAVCKVDKSSVEMVSRMLMRMMHAMGKLIEAISKNRKRVFDVYATREDTEGDGDGGDESSDDEDPQGPSAPQKGPSATDKPTATAAASKGAKGGGGGGRKKKRATQSNLTMENMYRHDLNTLWHRIVLL